MKKKSKLLKIKKPSGKLLFEREVKLLRRRVETFSGERFKPAEYSIVDSFSTQKNIRNPIVGAICNIVS